MEIIDKQFSNSELTISSQNKEHLQEAAKWAYFLAIVGFVGLGLMILSGLVVMLIGSSIIGAGQTGVTGVIYLVLAALYFFPTYYMFIFAQKIKSACAASSQADMDTGLENLKSLFKFLGIMTIVVISLYLLMFIVGMLAISSIR